MFNKRYEQELSPFIIDDLNTLHANGIKIGVYSMRSYSFCKTLFAKVKLDFFICLNGSFITTPVEVIYDNPMRNPYIPFAMPVLTYDTESALFSNEEAKKLADKHGFIANKEGVSLKPYNVAIFGVPEYEIQNYTSEYHCEYWNDGQVLSLQNHEDSRVIAIGKVLSYYQIDTPPLIFGDGPNDIDVFEKYNNNVCVGAGCPQLLVHSMEVTLPAAELGVSIALRKLRLIKKTPAYIFANIAADSIGGVESHGRYFINYCKLLFNISIVSKTNGQNTVINKKSKPLLLDTIPNRADTLLFFNSGHWIEEMVEIRQKLDKTFIMYRTGGNEIPMAEMNDATQPYEKRLSHWIHTINQTVNMIITNSEFTEQRLKKIGIVPSRFLRMVGGVDLPLIVKTKSYPNPFEPNKGIPIVSIARFVPYKRVELLLESFGILDDRYHLYLIGDGPLHPKLKAKYNRATNITFLGKKPLNEVLLYLAHAKLYVQCSGDIVTKVAGGTYVHTEGMGRSILEATSSGVFVVATSAGALSEIITPERGVIVNDRPQEIAAAISKYAGRIPPPEDFYPYSFNYLFRRYFDEWKKSS